MENIILETTTQLWEVTEEGAILEPTSIQGEKSMLFEHFSDDEDGTFPHVMSYCKLVKRMDEDGASAFLDWYMGKKTTYDNGYCTIERLSKFGSDIKLIFKEPIKVIFGYVGDEPIIKEVNSIVGDLTWEAYWHRGERRQTKYCNSVDMYLQIKKYL
jgi:hypothetical protein